MAKSEFKNRLKGMNEAWKSGKETPPGIPDAIYEMKLQSAALVESQSSGKLMIAREHLVLEGEFQGEVVRDYLHLESESGPRRVAQWIEQMGYEVPDDASQLEEVVAAIAADAPSYTAQVKTNGDFKNIYIREVHEAGASTTTGDDEGAGAGDSHDTIEEGATVTFTDDDQNEIKGTVKKIKDDEAKVEDENGDTWEVSVDSLTLVEDEPPAPPATTKSGKTPKKASKPSEDDAELQSLKEFAASQDIQVEDEDDKDAVVEKIKEYEWNRKELTEDEAKLLESIGALEPEKPKTASSPKKAVKKVAGKKK